MTAPRALSRILSEAMTKRLADLGDVAARRSAEVAQTAGEDRVFKPLLDRITRTIQSGDEREAQVVAARAERLVNRPLADALAVDEVSRRMNPNRQRRTTAWDPEEARATRGGRVAQTPEQRAASTAARESRRAERTASNKARFAKFKEDTKGQPPEVVARIKQEYDAETERLWGGSGVSIAKHANTEGGAKTELKSAKSKAMADVNRRLQAKEITPAQAEAEYAQIRAEYGKAGERVKVENKGGDVGMNARVNDVRDAQDGAYYDVNNPEARDKQQFVRGTGGQKVRIVPGGLDQNLVTAASIVRRHIERMRAAGEIPTAPPDAAMPGIIRTAMKELRLPDTEFDDNALMRAYRFQARRRGAFETRRRPGEAPDAPEGTGDIEMAGVRSLDKMTERLRGRSQTGMKRQEIEESYVDDIARELDADEDAAELMPGRDLAMNVRRGAEATVDNPENLEGMSFRELESVRRGGNRAKRFGSQVQRMDEGAGEYASKANNRRRARQAQMAAQPKEPREAILQDPTGPRVYVDRMGKSKEAVDDRGAIPGTGFFRGLREVREDGGIVRRADAPRMQDMEGIGRSKREFMEERPGYKGERESLGPVGTFRSPFDGASPDGIPVNPPIAEAKWMSIQDLADAIDRSREAGLNPDQDPMVRRMYEQVKRNVLAEQDVRLGQEPGMSAAGPIERDPALAGFDAQYQRPGGPFVPRNPSGQSDSGMSPFESGRQRITDEADQDIDRLVRVLMERIGQMPAAQRDEYFAGSPLDRQLMLNRDRSRSFREVRAQADRDTPDTEYGGDAIPFPSNMGRSYPKEQGNGNIIRMILQALGGQ